jgi:large subunit ribosomal protein L21
LWEKGCKKGRDLAVSFLLDIKKPNKKLRKYEKSFFRPLNHVDLKEAVDILRPSIAARRNVSAAIHYVRNGSAMFAVIKTGGKQYKVAKDDVIKVERLAGEAGDTVSLNQVLAVAGDDGALTVGAPLVEGAVVSATLLEQARADKIVVFKKKRRQNYRRKAGHRQDLTVLRITDIAAKGAKKAAPKKAAKKASEE